ncbi:hypothetical protein QT383_03270 [Stenotrophomonas rhizophila]
MKPRPIRRVVTALCLAASLGACGMGGMWMNGDPSVGRTFVPPRDTWQKPGNDRVARDADWRDCGGAANGGYHVSTAEGGQRGGDPAGPGPHVR